MSPAYARVSQADLRRKTDRQLIQLARGEITRARDLVSAGASARAAEHFRYATTLLSTVPAAECAELGRQIEALRLSIDASGQIPAAGG